MTKYDKSKPFSENVRYSLNEDYKGLIFYVKHNSVRCVRSGIESIIMCILMVSWIVYILEPFFADLNNYGASSNHSDPIVVISIAGFVFLSLYFLLTHGWYWISKSLRIGFKKYEPIEQHYHSSNKPNDEEVANP